MKLIEKIPVPMYGLGTMTLQLPMGGVIHGCEREAGPSGAGDVVLVVERDMSFAGLYPVEVCFSSPGMPVNNPWAYLGELEDPHGVAFHVWWRESDV